MTYIVLTILIGLVIFLVSSFIPHKPKPPSQDRKEDQNSANSDGSESRSDSPEKLAQWVLKLEKSRTEVKERLCRIPTYSEKFFGRNELIFEILKEIKKGNSIIVLHGRNGVGKTALALELIKKYEYNFQNLKLYLNLLTEEETPFSIRDAMAQILLSFRPAEIIPENKTQLNRLYKKVLGNKQGILFLDNATYADQIKSLKPSGSWLVIVTSEHKLSIPGAICKEIQPLDIEPAQKFLVDCSLRLKPNAREVAKLCRGLPLALEMCGKFLSCNRKMNPTDFMALFRKYWSSSLLEKSDEFEDSLQAAFKTIFYSMTEKDQKVLCKLAVFPSTFDSQAANRVCEESGDSLQNLSNFGLLKCDLINKRYVLHRWIKEQLKDYLPQTEFREARIRHATFYLPVLDTAGESFSKGGEMASEGLLLFHKEWENIRCGMNRVQKNSVEGKKAAELFNSYMVAGARLLRFHFFPKECRDFLEAGLTVSQRLGTEDIEIFHLFNLGAFFNSILKFAEAKEYLDQAVKLAEKFGMVQAEGQILNELATYYLSTDQPDEAIQRLLKKQKLERQNNFEIEPEITWKRLGLAYEQKGEFGKALHALQEGLKKARDTGNGSCLGVLFKHLGSCFACMKDYPKAEEYFEATLSLARSLGKRKEGMEILHKFGKMYVESGDTEQALHTFNEGLGLAKKSRDFKFEGIFLTRIGDAYALTQQKSKAVEFYMQALSPLKKAKEIKMVEEINRRLNRTFEIGEEKATTLPSGQVIRPVHKSKQGKGLILVKARTSEFIKIGDNKLINYYIDSIEEIIKGYNLDLEDSQIRESLSKEMGTLRENNHHACATILKNKFSL